MRPGGVRLHASEDVRQVRDGVHAVLLAGRDERVEHGVVLARLLVADEELVRATDCNATEPGFGGIVVGWDRRVPQEAPERFVVPEDVADRFRHPGAGVEPGRGPDIGPG
jgi:hypothetical protein